MIREVKTAVEGILRVYPRICRAYERHTAYIDALASSPDPRDPRLAGCQCGTEGLSPQERAVIMKENDPEYQDLTRIVTLMKHPLETLDDEDRRYISLRFWQRCYKEEILEEMAISGRTYWRIWDRIVEALYDVALPALAAYSRYMLRQEEKDRERRGVLTVV